MHPNPQPMLSASSNSDTSHQPQSIPSTPTSPALDHESPTGRYRNPITETHGRYSNYATRPHEHDRHHQDESALSNDLHHIAGDGSLQGGEIQYNYLLMKTGWDGTDLLRRHIWKACD